MLRFTLFVVFTVFSAKSFAENPTIPEVNRFASFETLVAAIFYLETMYVDEEKIQPDKTVSGALEGIVSQLDPHTMYLPPRAFQQLTMSTKGEYGGIGIIVQQERGRVVVVSPLENTPAMEAGVKAGDEIVVIDGRSVESLDPSESGKLMRGKPGSTLKLEIRREGEKDLLKFEIERRRIEVESVTGTPLGQGIYLVKISSFQQNTAAKLEKFLSTWKNVRGLILDLRDNPGGLLDQAVKVSNLFLSSGLIVSTVGRDPDKIQREFAEKRGTFSGFPMVVLVNAGSASASEIVAGALQDHQRAVIMGTQTFGKGSVQTLLSLADGAGLKLTIARYYTPNDRSIQAKGITPDLVVPANKSEEAKPDQKGKKEAELSGHIESKQLSGGPAGDPDTMRSVKQWPGALPDDHQLVTAFRYLRSWLVFQQ